MKYIIETYLSDEWKHLDGNMRELTNEKQYYRYNIGYSMETTASERAAHRFYSKDEAEEVREFLYEQYPEYEFNLIEVKSK